MLHTLNPTEAALARRLLHAGDADRLLRLAEYLPPEERAIFSACFTEGLTAREIAALRDRNERPDTIRRRIRKILRRLRDPRFHGALRLLHLLNGNRRRVAELCFLQGLPPRAAAQHLQLTIHAVRRHHAALSALIEAQPATPSTGARP